MKKSYLKSFINAVITEQQKYFNIAAERDYAIMLFQRGVVYNCILYDVEEVETLIDNKLFNYVDDIKSNPVVAYVSFLPNQHNKCYNGAEVMMSAARKDSKMGIVAYESALYYATRDFGGLYADRSKPSSSALEVWKKYAERSDVEHLHFDDIENPKTPPPNDDCQLVSPSGKKSMLYIDNVYRLKEKPSALSSLEASHQKFINSGIIKEEEFKKQIKVFASVLFDHAY